MASKAKTVRVEVRPISNGYIITHHKESSKGYERVERFTDKDPLVKAKPGAVRKASGPINMKRV